jgi:hypothetical protein
MKHTKRITRRITKPIKRLHKRIYTTNREHNLSTLYILITVIALIYVFPIIVNTVVTLTMLSVITGLGLVSYVVVNRTNDYRQRPLQQRLIEALPDNAFKYIATAKFLSGHQWKVVNDTPLLETTIEDEVIDVTPTVKQLSLPQAIKQSTTDSWLIGQNDSNYCEINISDLVHIGLIGATKTGKTSSTALLAMVYALKYKWHVIALDGKDGIDWGKYSDYIECYPTTYTSFPNQIDQICGLHELRMQELKTNQVSNIDEMEGLNHVLVILEEFGYVCDSLKAADKKQYDTTVNKLANLMRVSRATGIHFLIIDQKPNSWPNAVTANVKGWIGYRIKGRLANGVGLYYLDKLAPVGEFSYEDDNYKAWYTKGEIDSLLSKVAKNRVRLLKGDSGSVGHIDTNKVEGKIEGKVEGIVSSNVVPTNQVMSVAKSIADLPPTSTLHNTPNNTNTPKLSKAITNRQNFIDSLVAKIKSGDSINDTKLRHLHKEFYNKAIDGNSSKIIIEYLNTVANS